MDNRIFATYNGLTVESPLPELCRDLFARQLKTWEALNIAYRGLKSAARREIPNDDFSWVMQFNPGRVTSAEARIDPATLEKRACFLCRNHLPQDQMAILYRASFVILCNPFPIFTPHFTIAHIEHLPQTIVEHVSTFLQLSRDFSPGFSIFYNGPQCGASAPDHLHFQGFPAGAIPIEGEVDALKGTFIKRIKDVSLFAFGQAGRHFLLLEGESGNGLTFVLGRVLTVMGKSTSRKEEAMVNIIATFEKGRWRVFIFPRRKHRPDAFFRRGNDRRAITPGAVEMGGLVIATNERDFIELDHEQLLEIFMEVSVDKTTMRKFVEGLRGCSG